jgi:streptomycin 6-kinase
LRIRTEAAALAFWSTPHVPRVLAVDEGTGALLLEAIEPGESLMELGVFPGLDPLAALIRSVHRAGASHAGSASRRFPGVADRVQRLFESGLKDYDRRSGLEDVVSRAVYEHGRRLARELAVQPCEPVLLHGDLTPNNTLDGGPRRGLVAIDPAPCWGDPAFDAIDFVFFWANDASTIRRRAEGLADAIGVERERLTRWCQAFAAMNALEIAADSEAAPGRVAHLMSLATEL